MAQIIAIGQRNDLWKTIMTKGQKIQNDSWRNPESLAKSYFKNSDITNLEPDLLVESHLQCEMWRVRQCMPHSTKQIIIILY